MTTVATCMKQVNPKYQLPYFYVKDIHLAVLQCRNSERERKGHVTWETVVLLVTVKSR